MLGPIEGVLGYGQYVLSMVHLVGLKDEVLNQAYDRVFLALTLYTADSVEKGVAELIVVG